MRNLWSEGGAAVTRNVNNALSLSLSVFFFFIPAQSQALSQHLSDCVFFGLAFNVPCASASDPHMQALGVMKSFTEARTSL